MLDLGKERRRLRSEMIQKRKDVLYDGLVGANREKKKGFKKEANRRKEVTV